MSELRGMLGERGRGYGGGCGGERKRENGCLVGQGCGESTQILGAGVGVGSGRGGEERVELGGNSWGCEQVAQEHAEREHVAGGGGGDE